MSYQSAGTDWVIVVTHDAAEEVAERSLQQSGYRVYLPRYRKLLRPHGSERRGQPSLRPLFEGYLFIQDWRGWPSDTRKVRGVERVMQRPGSRPYYLGETDIDALRRKEWIGAFDDAPPPHGKREMRDDIKIGSRVEFDLAAERQRAAVDGLTPAGRAIITAIMFNREVRFELDVDELELVSS